MSTVAQLEKSSGNRLSVWIAAAFAIALGSFLWVALPAFRMGLAGDDFVHLVEDISSPWYFSQDHLYRPLRNLSFRVLPRLFGVNPFIYHSLSIFCFAFCLVLLYVFLRKQEIGRAASITACCVVGLFPRDDRVLFWFAAGQDLVMGCAVLSALIGWTVFRKSGSRLGYIGAIAAFAIGLGFKEPALMLVGMLMTLDVYHSADLSVTLCSGAFWRPYAGFLTVLIPYAAFIVWFGHGQLATPHNNGIYGFMGVRGGAIGLTRTVLNLLLPFTRPFALRDVTLQTAAMAVLVLVALLATVAFARTWRVAALGLCWTLTAMLPTSLFARTNGDQYLFLPLLCTGFALALTADRLYRRSPQTQPLIAVLLAVYCIFGARQLGRERADWEYAGATVSSVVHAFGKLNPPPSAVEFLNIPHSRSTVPILNNGLKGALASAGYNVQLPLAINFVVDSGTPEQRELIASVLKCPEPQTNYGTVRRLLVWQGGYFVDRTGACAERIADADEPRRPSDWTVR